MPAPLAFSGAMIAKSASISRSVSAAVGSSITMMRALRASAFAISIELLLRRPKAATSRTSSGKLDAEFVDDRVCARSRAALRRERSRASARAEHDVLDRRQLRDEVELLIDHADARAFGGARRVDVHGRCRRCAIVARVGALRAGEDLHQRRFARTVFADERVHFAASRASSDTSSSARTPGNDLPDAAHLEQRSAARFTGALLRVGLACTYRRRRRLRAGGVLPVK